MLRKNIDNHTHLLNCKNSDFKRPFSIEKSFKAKDYVKILHNNPLTEVGLIFDDFKLFSKIKLKLPISIFPIYWFHNPRTIDITLFRVLLEGNAIGAIKIHPYLDDYELTPVNIDILARLAVDFNKPILFHSEDSAKACHLTSPDRIEEILITYPKTKFIIGHGGAYVSPRLVPGCYGYTGYFSPNRKPYSIHYLLDSSLNFTIKYKNAFYDSTVCLNPTKVKIICNKIKRYPKLAEKVFLGTDFPFHNFKMKNQVERLRQYLSNDVVEKIANNSFSQLV